MYRIIKNGAELALIEAPSYVRQARNGCFVLCQEAEAAGIAHNGTVYHLLGREALEGAESVILEAADAGAEIQTTRESAAQNAKLSGQLSAAARLYVQAATDVPDETALEMPDLFKTWEEVLAAGVTWRKNPSSTTAAPCTVSWHPAECFHRRTSRPTGRVCWRYIAPLIPPTKEPWRTRSRGCTGWTAPAACITPITPLCISARRI